MAALSFIRADFNPPASPDPVPQAPPSDLMMTGLAGYIRECYQNARQNRENLMVDQRMMSAMRSLRGEYDGETLRDIRAFGGSEVYARITASKVRGCAALLREIYTSTERPWALSPTPVPALNGPTLDELVKAVLMAEVTELAANGMTPQLEAVKKRAAELREELSQQRMKNAETALRTRESAIDDVLWEGGFYEALWAFLGDIATFPFAVLKGPVIRYKNVLVWEQGKPSVQRVPSPMWERCSPFDVYFAPWSQNAQDGYIIHRERVSRSAVQSLRGLSNYSTEAIDRLLANWPTTNCEWYDSNESERARLEQRESQHSAIYSSNGNERPLPMLSFYGSVSGEMIRDWGGLPADMVPSDATDINVFAYQIGGEVIGVTLNPHPTGRLPFYTDSFERVPGSCYGNAIPDLLEDVQGVGNAALRALTNNLAIASGPMAWINEDRLAENDPNGTRLWPWKVFRFNDSITSGQSEEPMKFFQPNSNVQQLFMVYDRFLAMADELSTIPRYMQGSGSVGGAGRTAAGLSMLMEASNRTIKQTVSSIDTNVVEMVVEDLNVYLALTRPDIVMEGDISVIARGATELMQRETLRMRRIEFLNVTNNSVDQQLVGLEGRFHVLREVARDLGMPVADAIPLSEQQIKTIQQLMLQQSMQALAGGGPTGQQVPPAGGQEPTPVEGVARSPETNPGA